MSFITIKKSNKESDLIFLKARLESEGIRCFLKNEFTTQIINYIPSFDIELQVLKSEFVKAQNILIEIEAN